MKKNKEIINTLIKRNNLIKLLNKEGIGRASPKAIKEIGKKIQFYLKKIIKKAKENMAINGRTTLKKEDIEYPEAQQEKMAWEI